MTEKTDDIFDDNNDTLQNKTVKDRSQENTMSTADNIEETENEQDEKNNHKINLKEIIKGESSFTFVKVIITSLTAISMALISSQLTGLINSLILVGLVSIGTAVISEFYRIVFTLTTVSAKKVVLKAEDDTPTITTEIETVEDYKDNRALAKIEKEQKDSSKIQRIINKIRKTFIISKKIYRKNHFLRFIILFAFISIMTIGINHYFFDNGNNTTIQTRETLSKSEKDAIVSEAVKKSQESTDNDSAETEHTTIVEKVIEDGDSQQSNDENNTDNSNNDSTTTKDTTEDTSSSSSEQSSTSSTGSTNNDNTDNTSNSTTSTNNDSTTSKYSDDDINTLITRLDQLEEENNTLKTQVEDLEKKSNSSTATNSPSTTTAPSTTTNDQQISDLQQQIDDLQQQLKELQSSNSNSSSTSSNGTTTGNSSINSNAG